MTAYFNLIIQASALIKDLKLQNFMILNITKKYNIMK